jgi:hypothetical protein
VIACKEDSAVAKRILKHLEQYPESAKSRAQVGGTSRDLRGQDTVSPPKPCMQASFISHAHLLKFLFLERLGNKTALARIAARARTNVGVGEQESLSKAAETEALGFHEGNFACYQINPVAVQGVAGNLEQGGRAASRCDGG